MSRNPDQKRVGKAKQGTSGPEMAYVSATFQHLVEPITALHQQMLKRGTAAPTEVQASPAENGYAIAIVALVAFLIEGACAKARYVKNNTKRISAVETLKW